MILVRKLAFLVVAPVLMFLFLGSIYSRIYIDKIAFGVVDLDNSPLSRTLVRQLGIHPGLEVNLYAESEVELGEAVVGKHVHGGIVIPRGFDRDVALKKAPQVLLLVDGTNITVGNSVQSYAGTVLATVSAGFQLSSLQGRGVLPAQAQTILSSFSFADRTLYDPTLSFLRYQFHMVCLFVVQMLFFANFLVPLLIRTKKDLREAGPGSPGAWLRFRDVGLEILASAAVLCLSSYLGFWAAEAAFHVPVLGGLAEHCALIGILLVDLTALGFLFAALTDDPGTFLQGYNIFALTLILTAGIVWPAYIMPRGMPEVIQALWPLFNVAYPIKALHLKGSGWDLVLPRVLQGLVFAAFWAAVGVAAYRRSLRRSPVPKENTP